MFSLTSCFREDAQCISVSQLRKYVPDSDHIISYGPLQIQEDMSYTEEPVQIHDRKEKQLRSKNISLVKILWRNQNIEEATWELEEEIRKAVSYTHLTLPTIYSV